jgi:hypothetical protein
MAIRISQPGFRPVVTTTPPKSRRSAVGGGNRLPESLSVMCVIGMPPGRWKKKGTETARYRTPSQALGNDFPPTGAPMIPAQAKQIPR